MSKPEAPLNGLNLTAERLVGRKAIDVIAPLQGINIDLIQVLEAGFTPDHAHCYWPYLPSDLQERAEKYRFIDTSSGGINRVFEDYYKEHGIISRVAIPGVFYPHPDLNVIIRPIPGKSWPPQTVVETIHMVDFALDFSWKDHYPVGPTLYINTTRVEGSIYGIHLPTYRSKTKKRKERLTQELNAQIRRTSEDNLDSLDKLDELTLKDESQRLIEAILAAKV